MKILETVKGVAKRAVDFLVEQKDKALSALGVGTVAAGSGVLPTASNAAVTFAEGTGFAGTVDMTFFYSAVPLVVTAMVAVAAVGLGIKMFRRV